MSKKDQIIILDYDPEWAKEFEALKEVLVKHLGSEPLRIEHVGSTSIIGMKAKPIIDLDIIIDKNSSAFEKLCTKLKKLGYIPVGDLGITGREAFKRSASTTPNTNSNKQWMKHNLYVCEEGSMGLSNHLNFRNYLRENPDKVIEYSRLKQSLAEQFPFDMDSYIDGKTNFIVEILNKTGMKSNDTKLIAKQNKLKEDSQ